MKSEITYQIILSVLANEATEEELHIFRLWIEESQANRDEFEEMKHLYKLSTASKREIKVDVDRAWENIHRETVGKRKAFRLNTWLRYAAMIAIAFSVGLIFYMENPTKKQITEINMEEFDQPTLLLENDEKIVLNEESFSMQQQDVLIKNNAGNTLVYESGKADNKNSVKNNHLIIPKGKTYRLILSDGSRIWLNSETELIYPTHFTGNKREVTLIGEAFFEVSKDTEKPFYVKTDNMEIKVLGTSFNVSCYKTDKVVSATLVEGSVSVQMKDKEEKTIVPSQQFSYNRERNKTTVQSVNTDIYTSWIRGEYIFKDAPLGEIIGKLQRWYDFSVSYQDESLIRKSFSLTVDRNTDIDRLLEIISYTSDIKLERTGNRIHIKKKGGDKMP